MITFGPSPLRLAAMSLVTAAFAALQGAHRAERTPDPARLVLSRPGEPGPGIRPLAHTTPVIWLGSTDVGRLPITGHAVDRLR